MTSWLSLLGSKLGHWYEMNAGGLGTPAFTAQENSPSNKAVVWRAARGCLLIEWMEKAKLHCTAFHDSATELTSRASYTGHLGTAPCSKTSSHRFLELVRGETRPHGKANDTFINEQQAHLPYCHCYLVLEILKKKKIKKVKCF